MQIRARHYGKVDNGVFIPNHFLNFSTELKRFEGQKIYLVIGKRGKSRSSNQNKYLWGVVYDIISNFTGYTKDEAHQSMKVKFLRIRRDNLPDTIGSTALLKTGEFEGFLESIRVFWATEFGLYIPTPNEVE